MSRELKFFYEDHLFIALKFISRRSQDPVQASSWNLTLKLRSIQYKLIFYCISLHSNFKVKFKMMQGQNQMNFGNYCLFYWHGYPESAINFWTQILRKRESFFFTKTDFCIHLRTRLLNNIKQSFSKRTTELLRIL